MTAKGVLLDIEGVLLEEGRAVPGAAAAVARLRAGGLPLRFLTNTTTRPRAAIAAALTGRGIIAEPAEILTPVLAAGHLLAEAGIARVHLAAAPALAEDLPGLALVAEAPEAVLLGDLHTGFTWERLNGLFAMLAAGARLVALHRNRFCRRDGALALDLGPFVAALEMAAGVEATVVGKPAGSFFAAGIAGLGAGLAPGEVVMVGDDMEADIAGARAAGLLAVQVRSGKFRPADAEAPEQPDARIASVAELPGWLGLG
ncbi:TIGR01458 family HAD-type hydrolase [Paralimibaculum aggregatum]|uniref:Haloacid dehalogenase-like hydrolase domain-containing protein 2 n=1 Tax=Paralimibaculum aggregatum TaxID=3036245 RepID=A0ABQ6LQE2_9RHOB|nr:TIGR01458 family HAD-type hydrolase [Limibaculum sp. NKW23]GMG84172.1 TIGR01458 family HAD-type hydrolase [Limibaculum sp. NKW23]